MTIADLGRVVRFAVPFAAAMALAPAARAGDKALAESLFMEGKQLLQAGQNGAACQKFAASQEQDPAPGTLLNLGRCNEALGKLASAWVAYKDAETLARTLGRSEQEALATERATAILPRISRLRIVPPPSSVPGLTVRRNGEPMSTASLGSAAPVDPGNYTVEASAPGYAPATATAQVVKEGETVSLEIPNLVKAAQTNATAGNAPGSAASTAGTASSLTADSGRSSNGTLGWVLVGAGSAVMIGGGVAGMLAIQQAKDAEQDAALCPGKVCTPEGRKEIDAAKTKALISTVGIGAGVAAVGLGAYFLLTDRSGDPRTERSATLVPSPIPGGAALLMEGVF
jgi:hypothetical protein